MANTFFYKITPNQVLFPEYPSFELTVKSSGWFFKDYKWSCLPGYIQATSGVILCSEHSDGNKQSFDLYTEEVCGMFSGCKDNVPRFGCLTNIPLEPKIGSKGFAIIHFGGSKVKHLLRDGNDKAVLYSEWKLINAY